MNMKIIIPIILTTFFLLNKLQCQTSEEEYLYATYGYQEQLQKGLDDKKGYYWKVLTDYVFVDESRKLLLKQNKVSKFEFEGLFRTAESVPCAIVVIYKKDENQKKKDGLFISIPHADSGQDIIAKAELYFEKKVDFNRELLKHYSLGLG